MCIVIADELGSFALQAALGQLGQAKKKDDEDPNIAISKYLSGVLRHNAVPCPREAKSTGRKALPLKHIETFNL